MKGCIIERKGSYLLKYDSGKDPSTGKRLTHYKTVKGSRKDAQRELRRILSSIDQGEHVSPDKRPLNDWIKNWLEIIEPSVASKTFERYEELLRLHVLPYLGNSSIQKLTGVEIERLYAKLRTEGRKAPKLREAEIENDDPFSDDPATVQASKKGLSERTVLHVHRVLSHCLSEAARKRVIARNPMLEVRAPRPEAKRTSEVEDGGTGDSVNALDQDQLNALLKKLQGKELYPLVVVAAATGMRRGEILALRWSDLDQTKLTLRVDRAVEETNKKGIKFKAPKNKSSRRKIGIDKASAALLRKHWQQQAETALKLGMRLPQDALIFPKSILEPLVPITPRVLSKNFSAFAKAAGFTGFRFHDLRHTHATLLLLKGIAVNVVAQRLGHSTPVITLTTYGHVLKRAGDEAVVVAGEIVSAMLGED